MATSISAFINACIIELSAIFFQVSYSVLVDYYTSTRGTYLGCPEGFIGYPKVVNHWSRPKGCQGGPRGGSNPRSQD